MRCGRDRGPLRRQAGWRAGKASPVRSHLVPAGGPPAAGRRWAMGAFEEVHASRITGSLTMYDRLIFKGHLTSLYKQDGARCYLWSQALPPSSLRRPRGSPTLRAGLPPHRQAPRTRLGGQGATVTALPGHPPREPSAHGCSIAARRQLPGAISRCSLNHGSSCLSRDATLGRIGSTAGMATRSVRRKQAAEPS